MKKVFAIIALVAMLFVSVSCGPKKAAPAVEETIDSTLVEGPVIEQAVDSTEFVEE